MDLRRPTSAELPSYVAALRRGWSPNTVRAEAGREELVAIEDDPQAFLASMTDLDASGPAVRLPDGSMVDRLPSLRRWMWDGEFCGSVSLRWVDGTSDLPALCLGHVGYSVVPWKQRRGHATAALELVLPLAADVGLDRVEVTTDVDNRASQRVVERNGGEFVEYFVKPEAYGGGRAIRWRLTTAPQP